MTTLQSTPIQETGRLPSQQEFEWALDWLFNKYKEHVADYYDTPPTTWRQWVDLADPDDIALIMANESDLYYKFFRNLPQDVNVDGLMEMYVGGQLQGVAPPPRPNLQKINIEETDTGQEPKLPWQPRELPYFTSRKFKRIFELARKRVTKSNRQEVHEARKDLLFAYNKQPQLAEILSISQRDLNNWVRNHAGLTVGTRNLETALNHEVPDEHQWMGFSNSSWINRQTIEPGDVDQFVGDVDITKRGVDSWYSNQGDILRQYMMNTFLSIDTRISYEDLNFMIGRCSKDRYGGQYTHKGFELNGAQIKDRSIVISSLNQHTVAHEIGHYLDWKWGAELGSDVARLTDMRYEGSVPSSHKEWFNKFHTFMGQIENKADINSEYTQRRSEIFARFIDKFQRWTSPDRSIEDIYFDRFDDSDFKVFVRLLQEKSFLDAKFPTVKIASRIGNFSCQEVLNALGQLGYMVERQSGSHMILSKPGEVCKPSIPCHGHNPVAPGTLRQILRCINMDVYTFMEMVV